MILRARCIVLWALFLSFILTAGCQTSKGVASGLSSVGQGAAKDAANLWQGILKIDHWIRDNLW